MQPIDSRSLVNGHNDTTTKDNGFNYSRVNDTYDFLNVTQPDHSMGAADSRAYDRGGSASYGRQPSGYRNNYGDDRSRDYNDTANNSMY